MRKPPHSDAAPSSPKGRERPAWSRRHILIAPMGAASAAAMGPALAQAASPNDPRQASKASTTPAPRIHLNLTGYAVDGRHDVLMLADDAAAFDGLQIAPTGGGPAFPLPSPDHQVHDPNTKRHMARVTLAGLGRPGTYEIVHQGTPLARVTVSDGLWQTPLADALRTFYLQRCGVALNDPATGLRHRPCHTDDRFLVPEDEAGTVDPVGGWHHGDSYDKTVGACTMVTGLILGAYGDTPAQFADAQTGIPESGNGRPDALDEMAVGLDWLIGLQRADGLVRAGVIGTPATRDRMPQDDTGGRRLLPPDPTATALAAGALIQAARIIQAQDAALAERYAAHGRKALDAVEQAVAQAPQDLDASAWSARIWALGEWALLTAERSAHRVFALAWGGRPFRLPSPQDASGFAVLSTLTTPGADPFNLIKTLEAALSAWTDDALALAERSVYGIMPFRFSHGSNARIAMAGVTLAYGAARAGQSGGADRLRAAAQSHLHYLMGRNAVGKRFISGSSTDDIKALAHPMAIAARKTLPGFVVQGANSDAGDETTPQGLGAASHRDQSRAYDSNGASLTATAGFAALIARLDGAG